MQEARQNNYLCHQEEENLFQELADKYLPYWPLFLLLVLMSLVAAFVYLRYATPVYESNATILIKEDKKGLDDKAFDALNLFGNKKNVENEIRVLRSRSLARQVVL